MHRRAEYDQIHVNLDSLRIGKNQQKLEQLEPQTKEERKQQKRLKRLIRLAKDEEE